MSRKRRRRTTIGQRQNEEEEDDALGDEEEEADLEDPMEAMAVWTRKPAMPKRASKRRAKKAAPLVRKVAAKAKKRTPTTANAKKERVVSVDNKEPYKQKPTLLAKMKELAADAEDDQYVLLDVEAQGDADKKRGDTGLHFLKYIIVIDHLIQFLFYIFSF